MVVPVTVVTGFLGAGKTTLVNHLLRGTHGLRLAVIVNEFGAAGIDGALIEGALIDGGAEELFEMNNGCICCSVRGDLIRTLHSLIPRLAGLDGIVIETTGLADPGPVAQTFLIDDLLRGHVALDSITTVVDARHVIGQLAATKTPGPETRAQIAFADQMVLNKTDLIDASTLARVVEALRGLNPGAPILLAERGAVDPASLLGRGGYDLARLSVAPDLVATHACAPDCGHVHHHRHGDVGTVTVESPEPMDAGRISDWLASYLAQNGVDTFRVKGIVRVENEPRRLVFQAVHMLLEGDFLGEWPDKGPQISRIVFIGRNLDAAALQAGFDTCIADLPPSPAPTSRLS